jgi:hypothetical protein
MRPMVPMLRGDEIAVHHEGPAISVLQRDSGTRTPGQARVEVGRVMKKLVMALVLLIIPAAANARDTTQPCFLVDDVNNPAVILSGRVTLHHHKLPKDSEGVSAKGFYLKLDSPLRVDNGSGCQTRDEIPIFELHDNTTQIGKWNNRHVTLEGKLDRFPSALIHPAIFIQISTVKGD